MGAVAGPGSLLSKGTLLNPIVNPFALFGGKVGQAAVDPLNLTGAFTPSMAVPPPPPLPPALVSPPGYGTPAGNQAFQGPRIAGGYGATVITGPEGLKAGSESTSKKTLLGG